MAAITGPRPQCVSKLATTLAYLVKASGRVKGESGEGSGEGSGEAIHKFPMIYKYINGEPIGAT